MATYYLWQGSGVTARTNSTAYALGARMVIDPSDQSTNFAINRTVVWECTTAGTSSASVPSWPLAPTYDSWTLTDGTVTWTARRPGYSSGTTVNWSFATIYFAYAVQAAGASGDFILVHYTHQEPSLAADTTYTFGNHVNVISVNKDSSDAPTAMGTGGWVGDSVNNRAISLAGAFKVYFYGMTFRVAGSTADNLNIGTSDGSNFELESCYLWQGNTATSALIQLGNSGADNGFVRLVNTTLRFGNTSQQLVIRAGRISLENCTLSSSGSAPTTLIEDATSGAGTDVDILGCDLSHCTGTLVGSHGLVSRTFRFAQCKLGANVTILATQTPANKSSGAAWVFDCSSGDTHGLFAYYDAFGSIVQDTSVYFTSGAAQVSWLLTASTNASRYTPFCSPWIDLYHTGTSAITPYIEILTADNAGNEVLTDGKVWIEVEAKTTSGSTQSTLYTDRPAPLATASNQAAGAGTGSWTYAPGGSYVFWSGKLGLNSSITPAENGHIRARICAAGPLPNYGVFIDPQIRT